MTETAAWSLVVDVDDNGFVVVIVEAASGAGSGSGISGGGADVVVETDWTRAGATGAVWVCPWC